MHNSDPDGCTDPDPAAGRPAPRGLPRGSRGGHERLTLLVENPEGGDRMGAYEEAQFDEMYEAAQEAAAEEEAAAEDDSND